MTFGTSAGPERPELASSRWTLRVRVFLSRHALDAQIAAGRPYGLSPTQLLRASQLTDPRTRRAVARRLRRVVDYADRAGPRPAVSRVVLGRDVVAVMAGHEACLRLAERLEGTVEVSPKGVVLSRRLLNAGVRRDLTDPQLGRLVAERVWDVADALVWAAGLAVGDERVAR
jgi:hypothetical protein